MTHINHARRRAVAPNQGPVKVGSKTKTFPAQRDRLLELARELDREPTIPVMAYDARLEIQRLEQRLVTKRRLGI